MDIKGLDYNTGREKLLLPEYGREIQKMVDYAIGLPSKADRLRCAKTIVRMMLTKVPQIQDNAGYEQTLWDHLYLMSGKQLDIDWPYDVSGAEKIHAKPQPMSLPQTQIRFRHYGRLVEDTLNRLKDMPEGHKRNELVRLTANQMKRDLMLWGHGSIDNEKVIDDIARLTDGKIQTAPGAFKFERAVAASEPKRSGKKRK